MTPLRPLPVLVLLLLAACGREQPAPAPAAPEPRLVRQDWTLPAPAPAAQPDLVAAADGSLLLSWIAPQAPGHALQFARFADGRWSAPRTIARGEDWFVNWADTPHLQATADGALWAHWLRKSAAAPYAYDVVLARSADSGATWSAGVRVNDDGTPTEHGFVALWPAAHDRLGIAWLDGRHTAGAGAHEGHGGGMMTLRAAGFDAALARHDDTELDASTCDCCQTDAVHTPQGTVLVYRDRTAGEIRDIYTLLHTPQGWSAPRRVHADEWKMPACPVNGPAIAAHGATIVVAWYTAADGVPTLKLARSDDAGARFAAPVVLDRGTAVQGRVDLAHDGQAVWALWLREDAQGQSLQLARLAPDLSRTLQQLELARLSGRGRGTGFPKLALHAGRAHVVWTDVHAGAPRLHGAVVGVD